MDLSGGENGNGQDQLTHYEGTEKLLEVWFDAIDCENGDAETSTKNPDLRVIPREKLIEMLAQVKCEVVSFMQRDDMHAYVLSESSLFLGKTQLILKTCGTTTILAGLEVMLRLAKEYCDFKVIDIFYSRKNFKRPELQHSLYKSFEEEVKYLDTLFDCGAAYVLGRLNGDCWYLYTLDTGSIMEPDQTLEILMTDLDPEVMAHFENTTGRKVDDVTKESGIGGLLPDCKIDAFLFEPCGYSMNGLFKDAKYVTIHITPEKDFSYVSYETNLALEDYSDLVQKVISVFKPGKFVMTLFASKNALCGSSHKALKETFVNKYKRLDRQYSEFRVYDLTFGHYVKDKS